MTGVLSEGHVHRTIPKPGDIERAIDAFDAATEDGLRKRVSIRLQLERARPIEIALLRPDDFRFPASSTLRAAAPGFAVAVFVRRKRGPARFAYLRGQAAKDAVRLVQSVARTGNPLFTKQSLREARKALNSEMGRPVNAFELRIAADLALMDKFVFLPPSS